MSKKFLYILILVLLVVGLLPMAATAAPDAQQGGKTYTIQKDDTLSKLADKAFGDVLAYKAIVFYNNLKAAKDAKIHVLNDVNTIEVGWSIYLPTAAEVEAYMAGKAITVPAKFSEAPILADMVKAGTLPAVEKRLPKNPIVVQPIESVGKYGGTWHRGWRGTADFHCFGRINYEPMLRWPRDPKDAVQPGLAEKWEFSDGGRTLVLYLREGLKWSDGEPFTTDDILFWWNDIENDKNITKAIHAEWVVNGKPMTVEKVSDTIIRLKFDGPNGLALTTGLAFHGNQWPLNFERFGFFAPAHYLKQFHPKYNAASDYKQFEAKADDYNTERPAMTPWKVTEWQTGADHMIAKRNPYYWKVDIEGNQLPYIDEVYFYLVQDNKSINNALALPGKLDMQHRAIDLAMLPLYLENSKAGNYKMLTWTLAQASGLTFFPNQSYPDAKYRELLQNAKFRQALSVAMDRDQINQVSWLGLATPRTITVVRDSALFQADIENLHGEYDVEASKKLLDGIGLLVGADGMRTFKDGSALELVIETQDTGTLLDVIELTAEYWRAVGLNTTVKTMSRDVYWPRASGNQVMIATWSTDRGLVPMVDPIYQFPFDERSWMAPAFGTWYKTGGQQGEAPSAEMKELQDLYNEYRATVSQAKQIEIGKKLVRLTTERLNVIQTAGMAPGPTLVKNYFHNVGEKHTSDWIVMTPGTQDPSHYWMDPQ